MLARLAAVLILMAAAPLSAQGPLPSTADNSGTNPLNIQTAVQVFNEFRSLPDGLFTNHARYRYVLPLARRRMSAGLDLPLVVANVTGRTEAAFGDLGIAWSWLAWVRPSRGLRLGVDSVWSTATNDALGDGRASIAPFAQLVFVPNAAVVLGAGYAQRQSVGDDPRRLPISEGRASLYAAWLLTPTTWVIAEPEVRFDHDRGTTNAAISVEWGHLLLESVGTYVRPGVGLGSTRTRPFDWSLDVGFRVIP